MSKGNERESPNGRPTRVVSLPCGHRVHVDGEASLLALSGPVIDHQITCGPARGGIVPAVFGRGWPSIMPPESESAFVQARRRPELIGEA
jgi:hypothetical protein